MKEMIQADATMPGLYASAPEPLSFDASLDIRAFLLRRQQGNLLIYAVNKLAADAPVVEELGGIARQYLNHRHEASVASDRIGAPLYCHEEERKPVARKIAAGKGPMHGNFPVSSSEKCDLQG